MSSVPSPGSFHTPCYSVALLCSLPPNLRFNCGALWNRSDKLFDVPPGNRVWWHSQNNVSLAWLLPGVSTISPLSAHLVIISADFDFTVLRFTDRDSVYVHNQM